MALLRFALIAGAIILIQVSFLLAKDQCGCHSTSEAASRAKSKAEGFSG
jgi:hypothetical protein